MATGDIGGNIANLDRLLKRIKYPGPLDVVGLRLGEPLAALPLLHYVLLKYSKHVTKFILKSGLELQGKTDQRFVEYAFKLFRDAMGVRPVLTPTQFLEQGFAERKVLLLCDVVHACRRIHADLAREERIAEVKAYKLKPKTFKDDTVRQKDSEIKLNKGSITQVTEVMRKLPAWGTDAPAHVTYDLEEVFTETEMPDEDQPSHLSNEEAEAWQSSMPVPYEGRGAEFSHAAAEYSDQQQDATQQGGTAGDAVRSGWMPQQRTLAQPSEPWLQQHEQQQQEQEQPHEQDYSAWLADSLRRMAALRGAGSNSNSDQSRELQAAGAAAGTELGPPSPPQQQQQQQQGVMQEDEEQQQSGKLPAPIEQGVAPNTPAGLQPSMLSVAASQELTFRQPMLYEQPSEEQQDSQQQQAGEERQQQQQEWQQQQQRQQEWQDGQTELEEEPQSLTANERDSTLRQVAGGLPHEVLQLLQLLQARLDAAEAALEHNRASSQQAQESLQARVTVLEGRIRFLENTVNTQQQQQQQRSQQQSWDGTSYAPSTSAVQQSMSSPLRRPGSSNYMAASPPTMRPPVSRRLASAPDAAAAHGHATADVWHLCASAEGGPSAATDRNQPAMPQHSRSPDRGTNKRHEPHTSGAWQLQPSRGLENLAPAAATTSSRAAAAAAAADVAAAARSTRRLQYQSTEELISSLATRYSEAQRVLLDFKAPQRT